MKMEDRNMKLVELCSAFWEENEYENFTTSQMALYFFLLNRSYKRNWVMPIKCPSANICRATGMSEEALNSARKGLQKRGLITFTKGMGRLVTPLCCLIMDPREWHDIPIENADDAPLQKGIESDNENRSKKRGKIFGKNKGKTSGIRPSVPLSSENGGTTADTPDETPDSNLNKNPSKEHEKTLFDLSNEDMVKVVVESTDEQLTDPSVKHYVKFYDKKEDESTDEYSTTSQGDGIDNVVYEVIGEIPEDKKVKSIDEIQNIILADEDWLRTKYTEIYPEGNLSLDEMKSLVNRFFQYLRNEKKYHERDEEDCRNHCINWIRLKLKNSATQ